jgi:hypothetical protein
MRSNRTRAMSGLVVALGLISARAAAEPAAAEPATEPAATAPTPAAQPTPRVAAVPPPPGARATGATWHEGFQLVPMIGVNSFQGDSGRGTGPGLRLGLLAGSRMTELLSLNVGFAFDFVNVDTGPGVDESRYVFDIGFNPLFHFPMPKLDIVAGPLAGVFVSYDTIGGGQSIDTWAYGWTIGANAGVLFPVGSKVRLGGLANFYLRNPIKICVTAGGNDTCASNGLDSVKTLALSFAAQL